MQTQVWLRALTHTGMMALKHQVQSRWLHNDAH